MINSSCGKFQPVFRDVDTACNDTRLPMCYEESYSALHAVIAVPSLQALSAVWTVALLFCCLHKHKQGRHGNSPFFTSDPQSVAMTTHSDGSPGVPAALGAWELPEECVLEQVDFWQSGRFGPICKGLLRTKHGASSAVVVKSLRDGHSQAEAQQFVERLLFQARVCRHDNVLQMLYCQTGRVPMYLVLVSYDPGNLLHFLWTLRKAQPDSAGPLEVFSERSVFLLARQVAKGLDYLLSEHRLVHGDVAARSVLLGPGLSARVSGLGVAFEGWQNKEGVRQRTEAVPLKWKAPEKVVMQLSIDRSDVWSFGILLYEMITLGAPPYPELEPVSVLPKLQGSYRMKRPKGCGGPLYDLMKYCWMWSFKDRPPFSSVIKLLDSSLHSASTQPICIREAIDVSEYNKTAGVVS